MEYLAPSKSYRLPDSTTVSARAGVYVKLQRPSGIAMLQRLASGTISLFVADL